MTHGDDPGDVQACGPEGRRLPDGFEDPLSVLDRLSRSTFRSRFHLREGDRAYARSKGRETIARHARELLEGRIGAAHPRNDGRQTPMRGHPVFIAQHATATCCRGCVAKWHHIPRGRELSGQELDHLVAVVMAWIEQELAVRP
ncbi:MAG: DUF4186 domain-containing protein [Actinomyces sp.]|nr:DUF4186 domain-containing protein [Actinomyces sp.]